MRKTKCKSCNGTSEVQDPSKNNGIMMICQACKGSGQVLVYTIQELRDGKVAVINDGSICDLRAVLKMAFPSDVVPPDGSYKFYWASDNNLTWWSGDKTDLPTQSVKIFLEEIEQEEKQYCPNCKEEDCICIEEHEFKWGEQVEASMNEDFLYYVTGTYCSKDPITHGLHIVTTGSIVDSFLYIRKPQKITLTLSQIAEKFNCYPGQIKIVEE